MRRAVKTASGAMSAMAFAGGGAIVEQPDKKDSEMAAAMKAKVVVVLFNVNTPNPFYRKQAFTSFSTLIGAEMKMAFIANQGLILFEMLAALSSFGAHVNSECDRTAYNCAM